MERLAHLAGQRQREGKGLIESFCVLFVFFFFTSQPLLFCFLRPPFVSLTMMVCAVLTNPSWVGGGGALTAELPHRIPVCRPRLIALHASMEKKTRTKKVIEVGGMLSFKGDGCPVSLQLNTTGYSTTCIKRCVHTHHLQDGAEMQTAAGRLPR